MLASRLLLSGSYRVRSALSKVIETHLIPRRLLRALPITLLLWPAFRFVRAVQEHLRIAVNKEKNALAITHSDFVVKIFYALESRSRIYLVSSKA